MAQSPFEATGLIRNTLPAFHRPGLEPELAAATKDRIAEYSSATLPPVMVEYAGLTAGDKSEHSSASTEQMPPTE